MKWIPNFNSSNSLRVIFVIAVFILLFLSSIAYKHNQDLNESSKLVMHTYEINIQLERLMSAIKDAETGQRGYIITRNARFLTPYIYSRDKVNTSFITLKKLTADNPQQQENLQKLFKLITLRFVSFENCLKYSDPKTYDKRKLDNHMFGGRILMENIRFKVDEMNDIEKTYLKKRLKIYDAEISLSPLFSISLFLVALSFILLAYRQISRDFERLKVFNKRLLISSGLIAESESIGNFSTWQWDLDADKIDYSDNQFRLLGFEPNAFVPSKETLLKFVHPDDKDAVAKSIDGIIENKQVPFIYYKIIRPDFEVRYFKTTGKLVTDQQGSKILLGINFDITDEHLLNIELQERNKELEKSNKELASFNHVASHDLQEPLRKIQTFISRVSDADKEVMSESGKNYITKIESSAKRMRVLIDDLLLFSRTNTTKKEFIKINLNELLDNAESELAEVIEEKRAVIKSNKLPKLSVIPYQIEQLFINLIGNSLKYSRPDIEPEISISSEKVNACDYPEIVDQSVKKFHKITFTDNGMGFDPQFKETIFILFQRLHSKTDYPGTGIGLAICKKIVENHKGHITADSTLGKGSVFTVFLPD
ncbi:CHASE3 domain sensor protein/nitrogen-specific signal transduction histidine kinase [Flavobacterium nitrogenifigens]|uniref:histidine kinase n=2 Tax=Flavobacterium TaxID=237 RepID=A0A7W7N947_9FLAO|nr:MULTISPECIES: CHASE3 domain-containing protein [Flavobacterium]MBB4803089.1 CHASE3 domain sensor protein/nitrogen-specific signal transduction histidine kinase [Flavobacterium nitrogenifigens]MBB6388047.1 CHASE3 domain sensor protein/nitrogen-specific signal transduction histidine kinase [Flavobacterium notoginsengisoli]